MKSDIRGSTCVCCTHHTKACATSPFSKPTEALPTPRDGNLKCVLCTLQDVRRCTYKRNTQARSRNHPCRGKAKSVNYSICSLNYPAFNEHEPYYIVMWPAGLNHVFPHYLINSTTSGIKL